MKVIYLKDFLSARQGDIKTVKENQAFILKSRGIVDFFTVENKEDVDTKAKKEESKDELAPKEKVKKESK